jgi:hypothetical protein
MSKLITAVLLSLALLASACGDDGSSVTADSSVSDADVPGDSSGDGVDECGQGQAFPDDPDFREAICRPLMAMLDLIGTDAEIDPEWNTRITGAILGYADRDTAMTQLAAVLADIEAAG